MGNKQSYKEKILGEGGYGTVSKITSNNRTFARKRMDILHREMENLYSREIVVMQHLQQYCRGYIICYQGQVERSILGQTVGQKGYDMEFIKKSNNLVTYLDTHKVSVSRKLKIMRHLALGLKKIHGANVVHRDIKAENVVIAIKKGVKIIKYIDFGLACLNPVDSSLDDKPHIRELMQSCISHYGVGTFYAMAPELFMQGQVGSFEMGVKADIWSLGILFAYIAYNIHLIPTKLSLNKAIAGIQILSILSDFPKDRNGLVKLISDRMRYDRRADKKVTNFKVEHFIEFLLAILQVNPSSRLNIDQIIGWLDSAIGKYSGVDILEEAETRRKIPNKIFYEQELARRKEEEKIETERTRKMFQELLAEEAAKEAAEEKHQE